MYFNGFGSILGVLAIWELGGSSRVQNTPTGSRNKFHTRQAQFREILGLFMF